MERRERWQGRWWCGLAALAAASLLGNARAQETGPLFDADDFRIPMWNSAYEIRGGLGYKDNVSLSHSDRQASGFWLSRAEAMFYRLPSRGWQFNFFATADDTRYFDAPDVGDEQIAMAVAQLNKDFGVGWKSTLEFDYLYQNQVFDLSATYTNGGSIGVVRGHMLSPRWVGRKTLDAMWVELEYGGTRQIMETDLDSYWTMGPRLTVGLNYGKGSEVSVAYQWLYMVYDTREQSDLEGVPITNTVLAVQTHVADLSWVHVPDAKGRWQITMEAGAEYTTDNGSGFYDYTLYRISEQVRYRAPAWELNARATVGFYDYANQQVSATDASRRQRTLLGVSVRAEKRLSKRFGMYASYHLDRSLSRLEFDDYLANTVMGGFAFAF